MKCFLSDIVQVDLLSEFKCWTNGKCLANKHHQTLFGDQTFYRLDTLFGSVMYELQSPVDFITPHRKLVISIRSTLQVRDHDDRDSVYSWDEFSDQDGHQGEVIPPSINEVGVGR